MEIKRTGNKWEIEASTRHEAEHLDFLFEALKEVHARPVSTADSSQASHSLPSGHTPCMAVSS